MKMLKKLSVMVLSAALIFGLVGTSSAATSINLGTAGSYAVLAGSTITNTGSSVINGNLGLSPGTSVTGFPPGTLNGTQHIADTAADQAKTALDTAYSNAAGQTPVSTMPTELGGTTKFAGIYDSETGTFGITGTLTLDGQGDDSSVFIFKTASTLITAGSSRVNLINGAQACHVFWQIGSSATLGTDSTFKGNILASMSITLTTGASVEGSVLAQNGAVTLDTNAVSQATCKAITPVPATLHVIKHVVNNDLGTATASQFNLHVLLDGTDVKGSPAIGATDPGTAYTLVAGTYVVSETAQTFYTQSLSGDCDTNGNVILAAGDVKTCIVTNDDITATIAPISTPISTPIVPSTSTPPITGKVLSATTKVSVTSFSKLPTTGMGFDLTTNNYPNIIITLLIMLGLVFMFQWKRIILVFISKE